MTDKVLEIRINPERHILGKWLRARMRKKGIRFSQFRDALGVESNRFNRIMADKPGEGQPEAPTAEECHRIAEFFQVDPEVILDMAARVERANLDREEITELPEEERFRII